MHLLIRNARIVDPKNGIDETLDILTHNRKILEIKKKIDSQEGAIEVDAKGLVAVPGFIDMHVHFREPGFEQKETIATGGMSALKGGVVAAVTMPNTNPPCDHQSVIDNIIRKAKELPLNVFPSGTLSKNREGKELSEMTDLKRAGAIAVTDDGSWLYDSLLMRRAMEYAGMLGLLVITHAEDHRLSTGGVMNESLMSTKLGMQGTPNAAEDVAILRDVELCRLTKAPLHIAHLSTKGAVEIVRRAKAEGLPVTAEVTPHHLALTDESIKDYDTDFKMNPPLRTEEDRQAILKGLKDGTIDTIATDHAPHTEEEKMAEFQDAPVGVIGLETSASVVLTELYHKKVLTLEEIIRKMSIRPAEILKLPSGFGEIKVGTSPNIAFLNLDQEWEVKKEGFASKSKNSCFIGRKLRGRVAMTVCEGKLWKW